MASPVPVSVVMPVYNGARYLAAALESVRTQSFADYEFIIADDGSTDGSAAIAGRYAAADRRVRLLSCAHLGLPEIRNVAWRAATGRYIAWADADDVLLPRRLERQVGFMEGNGAIGVCGSWVRTLGTERAETWRYPTSDAAIRARMLFNSPIANPAAMVRRELYTEAGLSYRYPVAEDYDFWLQAAGHVRFANLPEVLLLHRVHPASTSQRGRELMADYAGRVQLAGLQKLRIEPDPDEMALHRAVSSGPVLPERGFVEACERWLLRLRAANRAHDAYPEPAFAATLAERWMTVCESASAVRGISSIYRASPLASGSGVSLRRRLRLAIVGGR